MTPPTPWPPITMTTTQNGSITITIAGAPHTHIPPGPRARYDAVKTVANLAKLLNRPHLTATAIDNTHTYTLNIYQNGTATDITHTTTATDGTTGRAGMAGSDSTDGAAGSAGIDGTAGNTGNVAFSGSGVIDATRTRGVDGVNDAFGSTGTIGITGEAGTDGTTGRAGRSGSAGTDGTTGMTGVVGGVSVTGTDGFSGVDAFSALFAQVRMNEPLSSDESSVSDSAQAQQEVEEVHEFPASSALLHGLQADSFLTQAFRPSSAGPGVTRAGEFDQDADDSPASWLGDLTPQSSSSSVSSLVSVLDHTGSDERGSGGEEATLPVETQHVGQAVLQGPEEGERRQDGQARTHFFPAAFKVQEEAAPSGRAEKEGDTPGGSVGEGGAVSWGKRALRSLLVAFATMIVFTAGLGVGVAVSMYSASVNAPVFHTAPNSAEEHGQSGINTQVAQSAQSAQSSQSSQFGGEWDKGEGGDVDPKADEEKPVEEAPTSTPTPTPNAPSSSLGFAPAAPAPAASPAPPAVSAPEPAPVGVTSLATSVSSHGGGAATLTVHVQGSGTIPVTVTIGAVSSTVNVNAPGSASLTLTPGPGRHTWTSNASGVTNTGSLTVY